MANVVVSAVGGSPQRVDADTVGEAKRALACATYTATVNGDPADDDYELSDEEYVALSPSVKGG
jgi:hypothetical protein